MKMRKTTKALTLFKQLKTSSLSWHGGADLKEDTGGELVNGVTPSYGAQKFMIMF